MDFHELNQLRLKLEAILAGASKSLAVYWMDVGGFAHIVRDKNEPSLSKASTSTVVSFLSKTDRWNDRGQPWRDKADVIRSEYISSDWNSSGLGPDNSFTVAFSIDAIRSLEPFAKPLDQDQTATLEEKTQLLLARLREGEGLSVRDEPPTSFVTYKALSAVLTHASPEDRISLRDELQNTAGRWIEKHLLEESVAVSSQRPEADVFELGYAVLCAATLIEPSKWSPRRRDAAMWALRQFFDAQTDRGLWPRSQPLFHYPKYGDAYCYDFEFLTELLTIPVLKEPLLSYLPEFARAVDAIEELRIPLNDSGAIGWATGHLRENLSEPESWATASVLHFCHNLHRLVIEAIRRSLFDYVGAPYPEPERRRDRAEIPASRFLDSPVERDGEEDLALRSLLNERFLGPLWKAVPDVERGGDLPAPRAAILYGPPGTSKTQLAEIIAQQLGWRLVKIDPSHLTRDGFDKLHAETNRLFTMLEASEEIVVLLDEFDELVRDRDGAPGEPQARFLTTAMLPKLAALYDKKKIVYLLATNHVEQFDPAIARQGRFDMIVPVMPPTLEEKLRSFGEREDTSAVCDLLREISQQQGIDDAVVSTLRLMTYAEFRDFVEVHAATTEKKTLIDELKKRSATVTMHMKAGDDNGGDWEAKMKEQHRMIRIPPLRP